MPPKVSESEFSLAEKADFPLLVSLLQPAMQTSARGWRDCGEWHGRRTCFQLTLYGETGLSSTLRGRFVLVFTIHSGDFYRQCMYSGLFWR